MQLSKKQLLGVNITLQTKQDIFSAVEDYLHGQPDSAKKSPFVIMTPNPEQIVYAENHPEFARLLNRADVALPDGIGITFAMKLLFNLSLRRISGIDFLSDLVRLANKLHVMVAFVGGRNDTANKALTSLQSSYVELHGWSEQPKEFDTEASVVAYPMAKLARKIMDSQTTVVFVGLGAPKQEVFVDELKKELVKEHAGPVVLMVVGGSFDMLSGVVPRAPEWMQTIGCEWLYRLFKEPWRWKRQLTIISFLSLVFQEKFFHTKTIR